MCSNESILRQPQQEACGDAFTIKHWTFTYLISGRGLGPWGHGPTAPWAMPLGNFPSALMVADVCRPNGHQ